MYYVNKYGLYSGQWEETQRKLTITQNKLPDRQQTGMWQCYPAPIYFVNTFLKTNAILM